jgi:hypothetical protein
MPLPSPLPSPAAPSQPQVGDFGLSLKMDHMETHVSHAFQGTLTHCAPEVLLDGRLSKAADVYAFGEAAGGGWGGRRGGGGEGAWRGAAGAWPEQTPRAGGPGLGFTLVAKPRAAQGWLTPGRPVGPSSCAPGITLWELFTGSHAFKGVPRALLGHAITRENRRPRFPDHAPWAYVRLAERCWDRDADKRCAGLLGRGEGVRRAARGLRRGPPGVPGMQRAAAVCPAPCPTARPALTPLWPLPIPHPPSSADPPLTRCCSSC